jgi:hypothetical protein
MLATYSRRTGRAGAKIDQEVTDQGGEWWMTAEEALSARFADEVETGGAQARVYGLERFRRVPERLAAGAESGSVRIPEPPRLAEIEPPPTEYSEYRGPEVQRLAAARRRRELEVIRLRAGWHRCADAGD